MKKILTEGQKRNAYKIAIFSLIAGLFSLALLWPGHGELLSWDEVDYVNAARLGLITNLLDRNSLSPIEYWKFAESKAKRQAPILPADYDESRDTLNIRHYHPPLVVAMMSILPEPATERECRAVQLVGALLFSVVVLLAYVRASANPTYTGFVVVVLLVIWMNVFLFSWITFHGWMAIWATAATMFFTRWLEERDKVAGGICCLCAAFSLLSLETGALLLSGMGICLFIWRPRPSTQAEKRDYLRQIILGALLIGLIVVILWPGAITKISLAKAFAIYIYRIKEGQEYAVGRLNFQALSVLAIILLTLVTIATRRQLRDQARGPCWGPYLIISCLYLAALSRFALSITYILPAFGLISCLIGSTVDQFRKPAVKAISITTAFLLMYGSLPPILSRDNNVGARSDLVWLSGALRGRNTLADGGHIYRHYFNQGYTIHDISLSYDAGVLLRREKGEYKPLGKSDVAGSIVLIQRRPNQVIKNLAAQILADCRRIERANLIFWDCERIETKKD